MAEDAWRRWHKVDTKISAGAVLVIDGGTGSEVEKLIGSEALNPVGWTSSMNLTHPEAVKKVHRMYLDAGADIIITNTYATSRHVLTAAGLGERTAENNQTAVRLAREAREEWSTAQVRGCSREPLIAGSISTHAPGGEKAKFEGKVPWGTKEQEVANYAEQARLLIAAGVDMIFVEFVWNLEHGERIMEALASIDEMVPIFVGFCIFNDAIYLEEYDVREGSAVSVFQGSAKPYSTNAIPLQAAVPKFVANKHVVGINIMHTKSKNVLHALEAVQASGWTGFLGTYPDCGELADRTNLSMRETGLPPEYLVEFAENWKGATKCQLFGGCCGFGPHHIRELSQWAKSRNELMTQPCRTPKL